MSGTSCFLKCKGKWVGIFFTQRKNLYIIHHSFYLFKIVGCFFSYWIYLCFKGFFFLCIFLGFLLVDVRQIIMTHVFFFCLFLKTLTKKNMTIQKSLYQTSCVLLKRLWIWRRVHGKNESDKFEYLYGRIFVIYFRCKKKNTWKFRNKLGNSQSVLKC